MEKNFKTILLVTTAHKLELASLKKVKDQDVFSQLGQHSIGNQFLEMGELSKTQEKDSEKVKSLIQIKSTLVQTRVSDALMLLFQTSTKVTKQL